MRTHSDSNPGSDCGCEAAHELISAAADGELGAGDQATLAAHIAGCSACSRFAEQVATLTRQVRLRAAHVDPELVGRVMARSRTVRLGRGTWVRPALAWCGVLVVLQSVRPLLFGDLAGTSTHIARHVGASALALAVGFFYAAWKPHRAHGLLPLVAALLTTTVFGTLLDTLDGARRAGAESVHVAELLGMVLLWIVAGSPGSDRLRARFSGGRAVAPTTT